jgi:hypothetical protein
MDTVALGILGGSLAASFVWLFVRREASLDAAQVLDAAAGLRERTSTSLTLAESSDDPFETAVRHDAERSVAGLNAKKFLPVRWSGSLSLSGMMLLIAALTLLIPELDLLGRDDEGGTSKVNAAENKARVERLARPVNIINKIAEENPDVDLAELEQPLANKDLDRPNDPGFKRREAMKQLNRLQDALNKKADSERFRSLRETKKRLRQVGEPEDPKSELRELMGHMSEGDFGEAEKEVQKLKESLAKRARDGKLDAETAKKMQEQLNDLSKKLKEAAQKQQEAEDKQAQRQLQNMGMSKEEAQRVLNELSKKDPEQLKKMAEDLAQRMKDKGVSEEQMKEMLEKLQQQQQAQKKANEQCEKMGQCMNKAAKSMEEGNSEQAQKQLSEAGEQLSEMEQMEQALNDIESQMDELQNAENDLENLDQPEEEGDCDQCDGSGFRPDGAPCPKCQPGGGQGQGQGQGQQGGRGRAFGERDRNDNVDTATRNVRAKTKQGRGGSIVGQQFVKGSQEKGDSQVEFSEALEAGEIDATDSLNRGRIPRRYKKSVKRFFDRIRDDVDSGNAPGGAGAGAGATSGGATNESSTGESAATPTSADDDD